MSELHADGERLTLAEQILQLNDHLEETARANSNQAFALALTAGLIPAGIFVLVVFMLLKRSLVGALFSFTNNTETRKDLIILVTPRIVAEGGPGAN